LNLKTVIYLLVKYCCNTHPRASLLVTMAGSLRHSSLSPSPVPSSTASSYGTCTPTGHVPPQITNARKRPSLAQLQRLQTVFDASHYITKEERNCLAQELELDIKFITVWFQNRRQSDKRKIWTKKDRAKKKENACPWIGTDLVKPAISLDQVASRMERVRQPGQASKPRAVLSPQKLGNLVEPQTPTQSRQDTLWAHMPSSPPEAPSSPPSDAFRLPNGPCLVESGKSLEWACANARVGSRHRLRKDKSFRPTKPRALTPCRPLAALKRELEGNSDNELEGEDVETSTPSSSQSQNDVAWGTTAETEVRPSELGSKSTEDVEAAMVLLQFLQG